ncbi:MAG TPA: MnmC family methyltransferase [Verrucomicrobiae bacterium]|nr:MnmC family methyltransferase [Verrucomicrobiae bacterium]
MSATTGYKIVQLKNGARSVHSIAHAETFHPGIGPAAEAEALYVRQLRLPERVRETSEEFVIWDVGLGAAANVLTAVKLISENLPQPKSIRIVSFDETSEALEFALKHSNELNYLAGFENQITELLQNNSAEFQNGKLSVNWEFLRGDFPTLISNLKLIPSHAILFDPHSPQKNPAMWTVSLFENLFHRLSPKRPCALANFTRSTLARTAMLLGGFFVGVGHATGFKEETTVAANTLDLIAEPLNTRWLERAMRSDSAEPLHEPMYSRAKLTPETIQKLRAHLQFQI